MKVIKLDNPQTWNLYAYVTNNPESLNDPLGLSGGNDNFKYHKLRTDSKNAGGSPGKSLPGRREGGNSIQTVVTPSSDVTHPSATTPGVVHREVVYSAGTLDSGGHFQTAPNDKISLTEKQVGGNSKPVICSRPCTSTGTLTDEIQVANTKSTFKVEQRFQVNGQPAGVARLENGNVKVAPSQVVDANAKRIKITPEH